MAFSYRIACVFDDVENGCPEFSEASNSLRVGTPAFQKMPQLLHRLEDVTDC
ncbi:MAG: hypothetical protein Q7T66_09495 [Herminiimonas sp.]|nr:hypothetical protein [Herminiimonas sp.]